MRLAWHLHRNAIFGQLESGAKVLPPSLFAPSRPPYCPAFLSSSATRIRSWGKRQSTSFFRCLLHIIFGLESCRAHKLLPLLVPLPFLLSLQLLIEIDFGCLSQTGRAKPFNSLSSADNWVLVSPMYLRPIGGHSQRQLV